MKLFLLSLFLFFNSFITLADVSVPALTSPVIDQVGLFSSSERNSLEQNIQNILAAKGPQIQVLVIKSLEGDVIENYSMKVAETWKIGSKKEGNGLLLVIVTEDRKMRIEVGQGIEGTITDYDSHKIIDKILKPAFRERDFYGGVQGFLTVVQEKFGIEASATNPKRTLVRKKQRGTPLNTLIIIVIFIIFIISRMGPMGGGMLGRRHYGGGYYGGSSGYSGGGGSSWGGGGGGFSGGGSSGDW